MRAFAVLWAALALLGCRERYHDTPRLVQARQVAGSGGGASMRVSKPPAALESALTGGRLVFQDDFNRPRPGDKWKAETPQWKLVDGEIINHHADNEGLWLLEKLPEGDVRIEFDARSDPFTRKDRTGERKEVFPGDLKAEAFGTAPEHQTGYVFIFGGWNNKVNRIARLEEHGEGAGARVVDGPSHPVKPGHTYRMKIIRVGDTLGFYADDQYLVHMTDPEFIGGRYFGFNNWRSHLTFDDLAIYQLGD